MYCSQCGKEIVEDSKFCSFCGKEVVTARAANNEAENTTQAVENVTSTATNVAENIGTKLESSTTVEEQVVDAEENREVIRQDAVEAKTNSLDKPVKSKKWMIGLGVGLGVILVLVIGLIWYFQAQAKSWEHWTIDYEKEVGDYFLSDEQKEELSNLMAQAEETESGKDREGLKQKMIDFKEQIIAENEKYIADIEAGLEQIKNDYDLTYAYDEELAELTNMQEMIQTLKDDKQYPKALLTIEDCKQLEEQIQTVKTGWNISVVQKDISEYPKVKLYLDVRDEIGNVVEHLDQKIFFLSQKEASNGAYVKKKVTSALQLNENESININLVADVSGSMEENMPAVQGIMSNFLNTVQFGVGDRIALTQFSDISYLSQNFTSDKSSILSQINYMGAYGGTKLYDTLIEAVLRVYGQSGAKCVIAFTDGLDNRSVSSPDEVIRVAQNCGIPIFIIGIGYDVDNNILSYISTSTGGYYTNALNLSNMQDIYNKIYTAQKQVYCLEYQADDENMMNLQEISVYLRGKDAGGKVQYAYTPSDDFFDMLLNNYLNSYIEALTEGDPAIMARAGYASTDGGVYKETSAYIQKHKAKLEEQLLQAEVTNVQYMDKDTYEITSQEIYDIQWTRDYDKEIAHDDSEESKEARSLLTNYYPYEMLEGQQVKVYKARTLKGHYKVKKSPEGRWQITDFTGNYETLDTNIYNAHIVGEE